jgi:putative SOS response-associated peptidase YedK
MCSQYTVKTSASELSEIYGISISQDYQLDLRVLPYVPAPVVVAFGNKLQFQKMNYSLVPSWSKDPKVKFATHNARIETLHEKPTWKGPLRSQHCLVPLTGFIESVYEKEFAGNLIEISDSEHPVLTAAGLWDAWTDPVTGAQTHSFAIITEPPPAFIENVGHDRCPVFLREESFAEWLSPEPRDADKVINFLRENKKEINFKVKIDRPLKSGWEKRK